MMNEGAEEYQLVSVAGMKLLISSQLSFGTLKFNNRFRFLLNNVGSVEGRC